MVRYANQNKMEQHLKMLKENCIRELDFQKNSLSKNEEKWRIN